MDQSEIWDAETARRYDTPGTGMFAPEVLGPTVDRLAELAGDGRALELAIGTGRVARPAARARGAGRRHRAVDARWSTQLRTKVDEDQHPGGRRRHGDAPVHRVSSRWSISSSTPSPTC